MPAWTTSSRSPFPATSSKRGWGWLGASWGSGRSSRPWRACCRCAATASASGTRRAAGARWSATSSSAARRSSATASARSATTNTSSPTSADEGRSMTPIATALESGYDRHLVVLSVLIAIVASYAALDLAGRVTAARGRARAIWLAGGAAAKGIGVLSVPYTGVLAVQLALPGPYDGPTAPGAL